MNMNDIAARIAVRVAGNTNREHLFGVLRNVCGNHGFDGLRGTTTAPFRACIVQPGKSGWLGVIIIDKDGNVFVEGQMPSEVRLRTRYRLIMAEMAAQKAADEDALAAQVATHGTHSFGLFFAQLVSMASYTGHYKGKKGAEAVDTYIADHRGVLVV
jgi:hypothetical protein